MSSHAITRFALDYMWKWYSDAAVGVTYLDDAWLNSEKTTETLEVRTTAKNKWSR